MTRPPSRDPPLSIVFFLSFYTWKIYKRPRWHHHQSLFSAYNRGSLKGSTYTPNLNRTNMVSSFRANIDHQFKNNFLYLQKLVQRVLQSVSRVTRSSYQTRHDFQGFFLKSVWFVLRFVNVTFHCFPPFDPLKWIHVLIVFLCWCLFNHVNSCRTLANTRVKCDKDTNKYFNQEKGMTHFCIPLKQG